MSKARLVITAVIIEGRTQAEVAATYGVTKGWVSKLTARYNAEGESAFEPTSRRPKSSPGALDPRVVALILQLREQLSAAGLDAGPDTIGWHLERQSGGHDDCARRGHGGHPSGSSAQERERMKVDRADRGRRSGGGRAAQVVRRSPGSENRWSQRGTDVGVHVPDFDQCSRTPPTRPHVLIDSLSLPHRQPPAYVGRELLAHRSTFVTGR